MAEDDARTLRQAQEIRADPDRLKRAKAKLKEQAKQAQQALAGEQAGKGKPAKKKRRKRAFMGGFPAD